MHETNIDMTHNLLKTVISQTKAFTGICQMNFNKEFTSNQSKQIDGQGQLQMILQQSV